MRLIDADALLEKKQEMELCFAVTEWDINKAPTIEAEPVKHGYWIEVAKNTSWKCSECGELSCCKADYCPDCGAKMDGGADNE